VAFAAALLLTVASASCVSTDGGDGKPTTTTAQCKPKGLGTETENLCKASKIQLTPPGAIRAAECLKFTIGTFNDAGLAVPNPSTTVVPLSVDGGSGSFYSDAACTQPVSGVTFPQNAPTVDFYFQDDTTGPIQVTIAYPGFPVLVFGTTIAPGLPNGMSITVAAAFNAGQCQSVTARITDRAGNQTAVSAATPLSFTTNLSTANAAFYSDVLCTNGLTGVTLTSGQSSKTVYLKDTLIGSVAVSVAATGYPTATALASVLAAPPSQLGFSGDSSATAGACLAYAVRTEDTYANVSPSGTARGVNLLSNSATGAFYSDAVCSQAITSVVIPANAGSALVYFRDPKSGASTLSGVDTAASPLLMASQALSLSPGPPTALGVGGASTAAAGICTPFTVRAEDTNGNLSPVANSTPVTLSSLTGAFYSDVTCASSTSSVTIAAGSSSQTFYFSSGTLGNVQLNVNSPGYTFGSRVIEVTSGAPTQLTLSGGASAAAGACTALTVTSRDFFGNVTPATSALTASFSATPAGSFFSNSSCTSPAGSATIATGQSTATIYYRSTLAGSTTVTAASGGMTSGTHSMTITSAAPSLLILSGPASLSAGACATLTVATQDVYGNPAPVGGGGLSVTLSDGGGTYYDGPTCSTSTGSVSIAGGTSSAVAYYRRTSTGSSALTATAGGFPNANLTLSVNPAAASVLVASGPSSAAAGACSTAFTITTRDAYGNDSAVGGATSIGLSSALGGFYSDDACASVVTSATVAAGTSTGTFYFKHTAPASVTISLSAAGFSPGTVGITVGSATATQLTVAGPTSVTAGACVAYVISSRDSFGNLSNVASATSVTAAGSPGAFYAAADCSGSAGSTFTIAAGTSSVTAYYKSTGVGSGTLTFSSGGLTGASTSVTVSPAAASKLAFSGPSAVSAGDCAQFTVVSQDPNGNLSNVTSAAQIDLSNTGTGGFYSDAACGAGVSFVTIASGANTALFYFKATTVGDRTLTVANTTPGLTSANAVLSIGAAAAGVLALSGPASGTAGSCLTLTIETRDGSQNPSPVGSDTAVTPSAATGAFYSDSGCSTPAATVTVASGTSTKTFYYRSTVSGAVTLSVNSGGFQQGTHSTTINPATANTLTSTAPSTITAGACNALTIVSRDPFGNPSPAVSDTTLTLSGAGVVFHSNAGCTNAITTATLPTGQSSVTVYFVNTTSGSGSVTVSGPGLTPTTSNQTVDPAAPSQLVFTGSSAISAGNCTLYTVTSRDPYGNVSPVATAKTITFSSAQGSFFSNAACTTGTTTASLDSLQSSVTVYFKAPGVGAFTITGTAIGLTDATLSGTVNPNSPTQLALSGPATLVAGACGAYTATSRDAQGNVATVGSDTALNLSAPAGGAFHADASCATAAVTSVTLASGTSAKTFYYRNPEVEPVTVTVAASGLASADVSTTINPAAATVLVVSSASPVTAGACTALVITSKDAFGNVSTVGSDTSVTLSGTGVTYSTAPDCGTATSTGTIPSGDSTVTVYYRITGSGTSTVTAGAGGMTSGSQSVTVNPATATVLALTGSASVTAGICTAYTITTKDTFGNVSNVGGDTAVTLAATAGLFYTGATCASTTTTATVVSGTSSVTTYFKATASGATTLTVSAGGMSSANLNATVGSSAATALALAGPTPIAAGECRIYTIDTKDDFGNPSNVNVDTVVSLSSTLGAGIFYSDAGCTTTTTTATVLSGTGTRTFYFRDATAQAGAMTIAASGFTSANLNVTVNPASPAVLVVTGSASIVAGACGDYTVTTRDAFGNASNVGSATTVNLGATAGATYADGGCGSATASIVVSPGTSSSVFRYRHTVTGAATLSASASGLTTGDLPITVNAAAPAALALTGSASTTAGTCTAYNVVSRDTYGNSSNVSSSTTVTLATTIGSFYTDGTCGTATSSTTLLANSSTRQVFFRSNVTGGGTLTATAGGLSQGTLGVTVTNSPPTQLSLFGPSSADPVDCSNFLVSTKDAFGNAANVSSNTVVSLTANSGTARFYSDAGCSTQVTTTTIGASSSSNNFYFKDPTAGLVTITASATLSAGATSTNVAITINNTAGSLDDTFGTGGSVQISFGAQDDVPFGIVVQPNDYVVIVGRTFNGTYDDFAVARITHDGVLDSGFGSGGKTTTSFGAAAGAYAVALDGTKIVVAGYATVGSYKQAAIARYNSNGTLDSTFGTAGKTSVAFQTNSDNEAFAVAVQSDGKYVISGYTLKQSTANFVTARFTSAGALDTTYNSTGYNVTQFGSGASVDERANGVAVQPDGKIVASGFKRKNGSGEVYAFALARCTTGGVLDTTFSADGKMSDNISSVTTDNAFAQALGMQTDGKAVVAGYIQLASGEQNVALTRYTAAGAFDTTFGTTNGTTILNLSAGLNDKATALKMQTDGKILVAGTTQTGGGTVANLLRFTTTGSLDTSFGTGGILTTTFGGSSATANAVAIQSDGKIIVVGPVTNTYSKFLIARVKPN
jgi:uncharacterized delta-60 repeat protein